MIVSRLSVSRVLFPHVSAEATISLGRASPRASSDLPADGPGPNRFAIRPRVCAPGLGLSAYLVLLPVGFALAVRVTPNAVRSYRTISPLPEFVSSPLSVVSRIGFFQRTTDNGPLTNSRRFLFCCTFRRLGPAVVFTRQACSALTLSSTGPPGDIPHRRASSDFPHPA